MIRNKPANPSRRSLGYAILLAALVLLVFGRVVGHEFTEGDDQEMILRQPVVTEPTTERLTQLWTSPTLGLYAPLTYTLWAIVAPVAKLTAPSADPPLDPRVFHALNLLLHAASTVIVFDLLRRLIGFQTGATGAGQAATENGAAARRDLAAFAGAALFAFHPMQVETVAWAAETNNALAGLLSFAAINAHLRSRGGRWSWSWSIATFALFALACCAKPIAIVTPGIILVIDVILLRQSWRKLAWVALPMVAIAIPFVLIGRSAQPGDLQNVPSWPARLVVVGDTLGFYALKLVCPWPLLANYSRRPAAVLASHGSWQTWLSLAVVMAIVAIAAWRMRRGSFIGRAIVAAAAVFCAGISIVSGIVPFAFQEFSTPADRYVYIAILGLAIAMASVAEVVLRSAGGRIRRIGSGLIVGLLITLAAMSWTHLAWWHDTESIWNLALSYNPDDAMALACLGARDRRLGDLVFAEAHYRQALKYAPNDGVINFNLGNLLLDRDPAQAISYYQRAIRSNYAGANVRNNLAVALAKTEQFDAAETICNDLLAHDPKDVNALITLANIKAGQGDGLGSLRLFREALRLDPQSAPAASGVQQLERLLK